MIERAADDLAQIDRLGAWGNRAGFEAGHVEKIGDKAVEAFRFFLDRAGQLCGKSATTLALSIEAI